MNPALVIIDMQKDFFKKEELESQKQTLVKGINELILNFRKNSLPVIWIKQTWKPDLSDAHPVNRKSGKKLVIEGTEGNELLDGLDYKDNDHLIIKKRYSGFLKTEFESLLNQLNIDTLVVCGINTHACVRMTVIDAYQRDYEVILAKDCVGSYDKEHHDVTLRYFSRAIAQIRSTEEIIKFLK
jgi:nicotinamidase-related amidase